MPKCDAENFDPPAPVADVSLRDPATGAALSDVPMLIDTGADITLLPRTYVDQLGTACAKTCAEHVLNNLFSTNLRQFHEFSKRFAKMGVA